MENEFIKSEKMTQEKAILRHLNDFGSITSWKAFEEYGITRLSAIIYNLRHNGLFIKSENITLKNRYENVVTFSKYSLVKEN